MAPETQCLELRILRSSSVAGPTDKLDSPETEERTNTAATDQQRAWLQEACSYHNLLYLAMMLLVLTSAISDGNDNGDAVDENDKYGDDAHYDGDFGGPDPSLLTSFFLWSCARHSSPRKILSVPRRTISSASVWSPFACITSSCAAWDFLGKFWARAEVKVPVSVPNISTESSDSLRSSRNAVLWTLPMETRRQYRQ